MSKWEDRVRGHAVQVAFTNALVGLENLTPERLAQVPEDVERLTWVINHVRERLNSAPAEAVPHQALEQMNLQLSQISTEVTNFANNGNAAHLGNANNYADALLDLARVLPPLTKESAANEAESYLERISGLVASVVAGAEADRSRLQETAEATRSAMEQERDTLTAQLQVATQQVDQVRAQAQQQATQLEQALAAAQTRFTQAETERATAFAETERQRAEAATAADVKAQEQFDATADELSDRARGTLEHLTDLNQQAEQLLGAIGVAGVAAGYSETAQNEKRVADLWRYATVGVAAFAAVVLGSALFIDHSGAGSWQRLVTRLVVSLSFAGLAAYCGRQSAEHRKVERDARVRQLQLAALNPYLANMPDEESVRLKAELAPGYFTPATVTAGESEDADSTGPLSSGQLLELVKVLMTKGASN